MSFITDMFGGGEDEAQATAAQTQQAYLPSWFGVPQENMLQDAYTQASKPYQPYEGAQVAGFSPDQLSVQNNILSQTMPATWQQAGNAYSSGLGMIGSTVDKYNSFSPQQTYGESLKYKPVASNSLANLLKYYDFEKFIPGTYDRESFTEDGVANKYMNPYIQEALDPTLRKIQEQGDDQQRVNAQAAYQGGAFGGSRHGVLDARQQKDMQQQLSDTQAEGMAAAYGAAAQLHGTERTRFLDAWKAEENSRQFGASFGLEQARTRLNADQFDIGNRIQQNQFGATHRLGALQFDSSLGAQVAANQASIGLQGANSYFTGGAGLGALSSSYMNSRSAMLAQQQAAAQQQQDLNQRLLDQRYTNYTEGRDWDKNNTSWLAQIMQSLRVPMESEDYKYDVNAGATPFNYADYFGSTQNDPISASQSAYNAPSVSQVDSPWGSGSSDQYSSWGFADGGVVPSGIPGAAISRYLEG